MSKESVQQNPPIARVSDSFQVFLRDRGAAGAILLLCAVAALAAANSPWAEEFNAFWETSIGIRSGGLALPQTLLYWVNDGLMALFFFSVGLEMKRELLVGELSSPTEALLPASAALGGAVVPAAIYAALNFQGGALEGWGVPMATDIAFALGVVALLRNYVPSSLVLFLTALAIADDLLAVLVIAIFYTSDIDPMALGVAFALICVLCAMNALGVRAPLVYGVLGTGVWLAVLSSGVHATIAGVLVAATVPATIRLEPKNFLRKGRYLLGRFEKARNRKRLPLMQDQEQQGALQSLETVIDHVQPPLHQMEHAIQPWILFAVMPLFALANAGVDLREIAVSDLGSPITLGIGAGLILGKPLGIMLGTFLGTRIRSAELPSGTTWGQIHGLAWLAGIGFTMSLFIAQLAFSSDQLHEAKVGILAASLIAGLVGSGLLVRSGQDEQDSNEGAAEHGNS